MKKLLVTIAAISSLLASNAAHADDVELIKGQLLQLTGLATQHLGAKNSTDHTLSRVSATCGFFKAGKLMTTGSGTVLNIKPGQTAYFPVIAVDVPGINSSECRIESAE
jgi:hypothetical protein